MHQVFRVFDVKTFSLGFWQSQSFSLTNRDGNKSPKGTDVCANKGAFSHLDSLSIMLD